MAHDWSRFEEREIPEDTPCLDTSFHDHELGREPEGAWLTWVSAVELELRLDSLDGDEDADGYSLDSARDAWRRGDSALTYAVAVRQKYRGRNCGDHCPNSCTWCGGIQ